MQEKHVYLLACEESVIDFDEITMEQKLDPKKLSDGVSIASPTITQPKQLPPCFVAGLNFQVGGI